MTQVSSPIVVFGAPRSGTTYLNAILNSHPDVAITHETRIFVWADRIVGEVLDRPQIFNTHKDKFRQYLGEKLPELISGFYAELHPRATFWGDKNPHYAAPGNIGALDLVLAMFDEPRFVHIMRDGRDVVASLLRKRTPDGKEWVTFEGAHSVWSEHIDAAHEWVANNAGVAHQLRYEDLVKDDVNVAREVFRFLDIEFVPEVEDFCRSQADDRTPLSGPTRQLTDPTRSDWLEVVGSDRAAESLGLLGKHLVQYGYETPDSLEALYRSL